MYNLKIYLKGKEKRKRKKKKNRSFGKNLRISIFWFKKVRCMMEDRASKK